jgi:hypothetical protein
MTNGPGFNAKINSGGRGKRRNRGAAQRGEKGKGFEVHDGWDSAYVTNPRAAGYAGSTQW